MKKIIALVMALMMVLCLAACGSKPTATIKVLDTDGTELYSWDVEVSEDVTAGAHLEECLKTEGVEYVVDGTMLQSIGDRANDTENWTIFWSVYVNGEYGMLGLWEQPVAEGDVIEIKYEESTW